MFLLRCAFFLSIVYVGISCGIGSPRGTRASEAAVASEVSGLAAAVARVTDRCEGRAAQCLRDAARLTVLVQTAVADPASGTEDAMVADAEAPRTPMPVSDPRRRAARAVLTNAR